MRDLGVEVTPRAYELHPEIAPEGYPVRPNGRLSRVFDQIAAECETLGLPFRSPDRVPNSRLALETAELVRRLAPDAFPVLDEALFRAHWVEGRDLGDEAVIDELVGSSGAPVEVVAERRRADEGKRAVDTSMVEARSLGVTSTPTWVVGDGLMIPGAQPRETIERWITRLLAREEPSTVDDGAGRIRP
jgi:predicted DsbA family dithiol-disulfide isomerase